jgi:formylglycine-generating enzyme required for sulfatase activity
MGTDSERANHDQRPSHFVYVDDFFMDTTEVTLVDYQCMTSHECQQTTPQKSAKPKMQVHWYEAQEYCAKNGKRLPTEAEWEKAARGTNARKYPWGNELPSYEYANFARGANYTEEVIVAVGSTKKGISPYGIYDLAGNVWEWVSDWHGSSYYMESATLNPTGPRYGNNKVLRGGAWDNDPDRLASAFRFSQQPEYKYTTIGFRCAKTPDYVAFPSQ